MHDIFYFTDVHGYYQLYKAAIDYCLKQDPESMIIYGGDACDRGPDGYKIMRELLDNPQVVYLKGNHEDMFVAAVRFILNDYKGPLEIETVKAYLYSLFTKDNAASQVQLSIYNGGMATLTDWIMDGMPNNFVSEIAKLPLTFSLDSQPFDFCHAGANYKIFQSVANDEYEGEIPDKEDAELILWDRNYLGMSWAPNRVCIYGHTPTYHLPTKYYGKDKSKANAHPCLYTGFLDDKWTGKKLDMDVGTYNNGRLYVLNCLTMQVVGFRDTEFENKEIKNHDIEQFEVIQL